MNNNHLNIDTQEKCPISSIINIIGGKWKLLIIWELHEHKIVRFNELKRNVTGITNTMLSKSLEELIQSDLVKRKQFNEMPLRVEYSLTRKSDELVPILVELAKWLNN